MATKKTKKLMDAYQNLTDLWEEVWDGDESTLESYFGIYQDEDVVWQIAQQVMESESGLTYDEEAGELDGLRPLLDDEDGLLLFMTVMKQKLLHDEAVKGLRVRYCHGCKKTLALSEWYACEEEECGWGKHDDNWWFIDLCDACAKSHPHPISPN
jgi:hypothetical protein